MLCKGSLVPIILFHLYCYRVITSLELLKLVYNDTESTGVKFPASILQAQPPVVPHCANYAYASRFARGLAGVWRLRAFEIAHIPDRADC